MAAVMHLFAVACNALQTTDPNALEPHHLFFVLIPSNLSAEPPGTVVLDTPYDHGEEHVALCSLLLAHMRRHHHLAAFHLPWGVTPLGKVPADKVDAFVQCGAYTPETCAEATHVALLRLEKAVDAGIVPQSALDELRDTAAAPFPTFAPAEEVVAREWAARALREEEGRMLVSEMLVPIDGGKEKTG